MKIIQCGGEFVVTVCGTPCWHVHTYYADSTAAILSLLSGIEEMQWLSSLLQSTQVPAYPLGG